MSTGPAVSTSYVGCKSVNLGTSASGYITVAWSVVESDVLSYDNPVRMLRTKLSIVVTSPSSTFSDKSFLISGDHQVSPICGNHMIANTVTDNSNDSA
uniref:Uncharacterized protein n=1 Tax=Tanacetum cinerariifolium TaxID=118510 RepID=A0A6L2MCE9_TANCI|nr:hypothetical protein [Tanacetum cinerariifolium]